ncbi:hypothetical protein DEO72_LG1g858 [Vigna unguiculata]|uniref:Uncharacterized protein n=1 Tax=Vigna unguiculata TaxID=3917 RepID=A0A4D6KHD9_VIGUN|nr:hypothetical protein DEO72_LG1g858 [Vigna unguiculata]
MGKVSKLLGIRYTSDATDCKDRRNNILYACFLRMEQTVYMKSMWVLGLSHPIQSGQTQATINSVTKGKENKVESFEMPPKAIIATKKKVVEANKGQKYARMVRKCGAA